jgi:hypothetical protein
VVLRGPKEGRRGTTVPQATGRGARRLHLRPMDVEGDAQPVSYDHSGPE